MAGTRYGTKLYGTTFYAGDDVGEFTSATFKANTNGYGRVLVEWSRPGGAWSHQRLLRNLVGTPVDEHDGDVLLHEPTSTASRQWQDEGLTSGRHYYYALFVRDLNGTDWRRTGTAEVLTTRDYGYTDRLYKHVPQVFKSQSYNSLDDTGGENETLARFLSLFGFQLDHVRTELEGLREANDARVVSAKLLPALAAQVGVTYEPELGDRAVRRFVANATRLYSTKGTLAGVREMATTFTGWDTSVRLGSNIALDRLDAGPDGGVGRWRGRDNATVAYRTFTDADRGPGGQGALVVRSKAAGHMTYDTNLAGFTAPLERLQYAIPVLPGLSYVASQYVRSATSGLTARMGLTWLDAGGKPLGAAVFGDPTALKNDWSARPAHTLTAPPTARYLEPRIRIDGATAAGVEVLACALAVNEDVVAHPWEPARQVVLYLRGNLTNYVGNTSGYGLSAEGWTEAVAGTENASPFLSFTNELQINDDTLAVLDSLAVDVPGDVSPVVKAGPTYKQVSATLSPKDYAQRQFRYRLYQDTATADVSRRSEGFTSVYVAGKQQIEAGQVWSAMVDISGRGASQRTVRVGFALYEADDLVGYDWSPDMELSGDGYKTVAHQLDVPANPSFDSVALVVYSSARGVSWKNAALEPVQLLDARQFDGSTPSTTLDYIWHGVPYRSPTSYYSRRIVRTLRLRELLEEFLPHPASSRLVFAPNDIPDSPRAAAGSDLDPDDAQTTTVGARARARWNNTGRVVTQLSTRWEVGSLKVGSNLALNWRIDKLNKMRSAVWTVTKLVARDVTEQSTTTALVQRDHAVRYTTTTHVRRDVGLRWPVRENTPADRTVRFDVRVLTAAERTLRSNTTQLTSRQLTVQHRVTQLAARNVTARYTTHLQVGTWLNSQWNLTTSSVGRSFALVWDTDEALALFDGIYVSEAPPYSVTKVARYDLRTGDYDKER